MQKWWMSGEPSIEELLADEIMDPVARSAGMSREELRSKVMEIARRIALGRSKGNRRACCGAAV
jgi:hypothetical protein